MTPFSFLDLCPITEGGSVAESLAHTVDVAQHAERWGFNRFWMAEHHGMPGIASAATAVLIGHVAGATSRMRVGAGGIMLPNHSPLVIAEQFGTLEALYPGRIELGLGRAPGSDQATARALRRNLDTDPEAFPHDVLELIAYFEGRTPVRAVPGAGSSVPIWILGSSLFGAQLAAMLGLPYAFASHFAPGALMQALQVYRERFQPSAQLDRPYAMVGVNVIAADTDEEARQLFTSAQQSFTNLFRGTRGKLQPPIDDIESYWSPHEKAQAMNMLSCSFVGSAKTVQEGLEGFITQTGADEVMVAAAIYDHSKRLRSYEILSEVQQAMKKAA